MAADGKSFITAVGSRDATVWLHDKDGDQPISSEGNVTGATFSTDGKSLYYLLSSGQSSNSELWMKDLASGKTERILTAISPRNYSRTYSVSRDGKQVVYASNDANGNSSVWIAPTNRRSSPQRISPAGAIDDTPLFLADGDVVVRSVEGGANFLYRMKSDGSGRQKITAQRVIDVTSVSPDGRWVVASSPGPDTEHYTDTSAFATDGSKTVALCQGFCVMMWDTAGKFAYLNYKEVAAKKGVYAMPVQGDGLPKVPSGGFTRKEEIANANLTAIPQNLESAVSPSLYAYLVQNMRRNLYRIPLQ